MRNFVENHKRIRYHFIRRKLVFLFPFFVIQEIIILIFIVSNYFIFKSLFQHYILLFNYILIYFVTNIRNLLRFLPIGIYLLKIAILFHILLIPFLLALLLPLRKYLQLSYELHQKPIHEFISGFRPRYIKVRNFVYIPELSFRQNFKKSSF